MGNELGSMEGERGHVLLLVFLFCLSFTYRGACKHRGQQRNDPRDVDNELESAPPYQVLYPDLPGSDLGVYFSYTFKHSETLCKGFRVTVITTKL